MPVTANVNEKHASLPTGQPRLYAEGVAFDSPGSPLRRTLGMCATSAKYPEGVAQGASRGLFLVQPLRGTLDGRRPTPGCAARPWAVECDPFGIRIAWT